MSLFDYLNNDALGAASSSSTSSQISQLLQQAQVKQGIVIPPTVETAAGSSTNIQSNVLITLAAQRANASAVDGKKDAATLQAEIRKTLDETYKNGGKSPSVSDFSARALAIVALNEDGSFSKAEVAAAKTELRERDRAAAISFINSGELTAASLKGYSQQLLSAREAMSKEELSLRDTNPNLR